MYLNKTSSQYKNYQDFEKYARFIGGKFNINIQLESTRAETDGRTIFLPNVLTMTPKELEIMYAILLHEVGHIRYSTFSEYYFSSLKTKAHAFIANCIEDARIENLLMEDFGGASEIFTEFYCENTEDKELMKRVFKHDGSKPDIFRTLGFYIHNVLVNCKTSPLKKISGARTANRILKFWKENNIESLKNDHKNARLLAEGLSKIEMFEIDLSRVETNIILIDILGGETADSVLEKMKKVNVWAVSFGPKRIRMVTHLDVSRSDCEEALDRIKSIFS